jgi:1,4-dihydroxy-6-naphthoate synthase
MATTITIAHSPDSDDAFMFYGLASGAVRDEALSVQQTLADIETLNEAAFEGRYDVTAISFHAYAYLVDRYALLPCGASMGDGYGPIVVVRADGPQDLAGVRVAVPGTLTTAFLALRLYWPRVRYEVLPFDQIQAAVLEGRAEAGVLIHEGQLTYAEQGLRKLVDLGAWWATHTGGLPLPLGGNVVRRDLGPELMARVARLLKASIAYGLAHRDEALGYARRFGRGLDRDGTDRFVGLYVNELTLSYGVRGRAALERLYDEAYRAGLLPRPVSVEFLG